MSKQEEKTFPGFEPSNTTPVPDVFFDELMTILSDAELRVLLYIIRRTWGFKKVADAISFNQFIKGIKTRDGKQLDLGCGVKNRTTLSKALKGLEGRGYIVSSKGKDPLGDNTVTVYSIRFRATGAQTEGSTKTVPPVVTEVDHRSTPTVPPVVSNLYPQETVLQKTVKQQTVVQEREKPKEQVPQQETNTNPSPSLQSQKKITLERWYAHFDILYRSKPGTPANFKVPRSPKNDTAILSMEDAGVTFEQAAFVFNDIWDDPDAFWKANRTITSVNSQFATRIGKMSTQTPEQAPSTDDPQLEEVPSEEILIFGHPAAYWTPERIADETELTQVGIYNMLGQDMEPAYTT